MGSLVFHRDVGSFRRISLHIAFRPQLPRDYCDEFGSLASSYLVHNNISKHLFVLAYPEGTSGSRPSLS
jgi:hypothetical protein